ncbi:hypothetical protein Tco_0760860 [Tanacetum coccineum]
MLFQPLFDELLNPPPSVDHPTPEAVAPIDKVATPVPAVSTGSPSSTIVDQDAPSPSNSQTTPDTQPPVIPNDISQSPRGIFINQSKYALESLKKYGFYSCDPVDTPMVEKSKLERERSTQGHCRCILSRLRDRGMIGTLLYLTASRPDLQFAICMCAVSGSGLHKSSNLNAVKQDSFSISKRTLIDDNMRSQLTDYGFGFNKIPMYCDNKSVIALCCNNVLHSRSKHIDIRFHFIKEHVENGVIELYFVNTEYQLADIFTKALGRERIEFLINKLGMRSFTLETLKQLANEVDE